MHVSSPWARASATAFEAPILEASGRSVSINCSVPSPVRFRAASVRVAGDFIVDVRVTWTVDGRRLLLNGWVNIPEDTSRDTVQASITVPSENITCLFPDIVLTLKLLRVPKIIPSVVLETIDVIAQSLSVVSTISSTPTVALALQRLQVVSSSCLDDVVQLTWMDSPTWIALGGGPLEQLRGAALINPLIVLLVLLAAASLEKFTDVVRVTVAQGVMLSNFLLAGAFKSGTSLVVSSDNWSDVALGLASLLVCGGHVAYVVIRTTLHFSGDLVGNAMLLSVAPWHRRWKHKSHHWLCDCEPLCRGSRFPWHNSLDLTVTAVMSALQGAYVAGWCEAQGAILVVVSFGYVVYLIVLRPALSPIDNVTMVALNLLVAVVNALTLIHRFKPNHHLFATVELLDVTAMIIGAALTVSPCFKLGVRLLHCIKCIYKKRGAIDDVHLSKTKLFNDVHFTSFFCSMPSVENQSTVVPLLDVVPCREDDTIDSKSQLELCQEDSKSQLELELMLLEDVEVNNLPLDPRDDHVGGVDRVEVEEGAERVEGDSPFTGLDGVVVAASMNKDEPSLRTLLERLCPEDKII